MVKLDQKLETKENAHELHDPIRAEPAPFKQFYLQIFDKKTYIINTQALQANFGTDSYHFQTLYLFALHTFVAVSGL